MIRFLQRWWWARQRAIDLRILWPIFKKEAGNLEDARKMFMHHAIIDPCWVCEYGERLWSVVGELT